MNSDIMVKWLNDIFGSACKNIENPTLILDNFSGHRTQDVFDKAKTINTDLEFLPPNSTPVLQPLDHSINASFKVAFRLLYRTWYRDTPAELTKQGKRKKPSFELVCSWIMTAWDSITEDQIKKCWKHTLTDPELQTKAQARLDERVKRGDSPVVMPQVAVVTETKDVVDDEIDITNVVDDSEDEVDEEEIV